MQSKFFQKYKILEGGESVEKASKRMNEIKNKEDEMIKYETKM